MWQWKALTVSLTSSTEVANLTWIDSSSEHGLYDFSFLSFDSVPLFILNKLSTWLLFLFGMKRKSSSLESTSCFKETLFVVGSPRNKLLQPDFNRVNILHQWRRKISDVLFFGKFTTLCYIWVSYSFLRVTAWRWKRPLVMRAICFQSSGVSSILTNDHVWKRGKSSLGRQPANQILWKTWP